MARSKDISDDYDEYTAEISDGCGCTEMWEYMSEWRRRERMTKRDEFRPVR